VAKAIITAQQYHFSRDLALRKQSICHQAHAVSLLRISLDVSNATLLVVAMLTLFEEIARSDELTWFPHQHACVSILLARPKAQPMSDMATAILYAFW